MVMVVTMVMAGRESGSGENHEEEGSGEKLFHGTNVARRC